MEFDGKPPNIFFEDVMSKDDGLLDKATEACAPFALSRSEVWTCPSRVLVQECRGIQAGQAWKNC